MKRSIATAAGILLVLAIAACAPGKTATPENPAGAYHPASAKTGIQPVDAVLEAVASRDEERLRSLVQFTSAPCTREDGLGGPPSCRPEEPEGTTVDVLAFLAGEGSFLRRDEMENWIVFPASGVYAIYEVSPAVTSEPYFPAGKYVILFVHEPDQSGTAVHIGEKGIVRVDHLFDGSREALARLVEQESARVILAPKN